jgi:hypothetical protein
VQDEAVEAAGENTDIDVNAATGARKDSAVALVPDQDVEFGIWRDSDRTFTPLQSDGSGVDERREANAVRAWARRVTKFTDSNGNTIQRNTGLKLMFAPILPDGPSRGEIQAKAVARLMGGRVGFGFIGLNGVKFNGTTNLDSYDAAHETYPGVGGPNSNGQVLSNNDITLVGNATIMGDVHPGVDHNITPYPLGGNVSVSGYMDPLQTPITWPAPAFSPPAPGSPNQGDVSPPNTVNGSNVFSPKGNPGTVTIKGNTTLDPNTNTYPPNWFLWSGFKSTAQVNIVIEGSADIYIDGDFDMKAGSTIEIKKPAAAPPNYKVRFFCNGNWNQEGQPIVNDSTDPSTLELHMTKPGTTCDVGGGSEFFGHVDAPLSDVTIHGGTQFYGWAVGNTLTIMGGSQLHYDESGTVTDTPYSVHLVE